MTRSARNPPFSQQVIRALDSDYKRVDIGLGLHSFNHIDLCFRDVDESLVDLLRRGEGSEGQESRGDREQLHEGIDAWEREGRGLC